MAKHIGRYKLEELIGSGGMGAVYRATHLDLGREVALKILKSSASADDENLLRFQREMRVLAGLNHPNVVQILDGGDADGTSYIAMELVGGFTVDQLVNDVGPVPWAYSLAIASCLAGGIAYLHQMGILHRDIKPANIRMSNEGFVKFLDFGLAKLAGGTVMTEDGTVLGTVQYMAPEILIGEDVTEKADIWALGCVMYILIAGRLAFDGVSLKEWVNAVVNHPVPPLSSVNPRLPPAVSKLVSRILTQDVEERPGDAARVQEAIDKTLRKLTNHSPDHYIRTGFLDQIRAEIEAGGNDATQKTIPIEEVRDRAQAVARSRRKATPGHGEAASEDAARRQVTTTSGSGSSMDASELSSLTSPASLLPIVLSAVLGLSLGIVGFRLAMKPSRPVPGPDSVVSLNPSATNPPATGEPVLAVHIRDGSGPLDPVPLSMRWKNYERYRDALRIKARGHESRLKEMKDALAPLDLGDPQSWAYWIELNQWLEDKNRAPNPPIYEGRSNQEDMHAVRKYWNSLDDTDTREGMDIPIQKKEGALGFVDERLGMSYLGKADMTQPHIRIQVAFRAVEMAPMDGRCWLVLGLSLELDNRIDSARVAYQFALDHIENISMGTPPTLIFECMARALVSLENYQLEEDWPRFTRHFSDNSGAWAGLRSALKDDPQTYRRMLERSCRAGANAVNSCILLSQLLVSQDLDADSARRELERLYRVHSGDATATLALLQFYFERGDRERGSKILSAGKDAVSKLLTEFVLEPGSSQVQEIPKDILGTRPIFDLYPIYLLEIGDCNGARSFLSRTMSGEFDPATDKETRLQDETSVILEILAEGQESKALEDIVKESLLGGSTQANKITHEVPSRNDWIRATGILTTRDGIILMTRLLSLATKKWPNRPDLDLFKALWLSRRREHREALTELMKSVGKGLKAHHVSNSPYIVEILARAIWNDGETSPDVRRHLDALAPKGANAVLQDYFRALVSNDRKGAAVVAIRGLELTPRDPLYALTVCWAKKQLNVPLSPGFDPIVWARWSGQGSWIKREIRLNVDSPNLH